MTPDMAYAFIGARLVEQWTEWKFHFETVKVLNMNISFFFFPPQARKGQSEILSALV